MSETSYFWQGGRKIEVEKDGAAVTIHADNEAAARSAADRAGVDFSAISEAAPGPVVHAEIAGDRDRSMERLRADDNVVHHVYRDRQAPESEYLITETFFIKFKSDTPDSRIREYLSTEHLMVERDMGDKTFLVRVTSNHRPQPHQDRQCRRQQG